MLILHLFLALLTYTVHCQRPSYYGINTNTNTNTVATTNQMDCIARSEFENDAVKFLFTKVNGMLYIYFSVKDYDGYESLIGSSCWPQGSMVNFHIHARADFEGLGFNDECISNFTGGHWDPSLACSRWSENEYCKVLKIPSSTVMGPTNTYQCTPSLYNRRQYTCEAGDLSGKYGKMRIPDFQGTNDNLIAYNVNDIHDTISTCELDNKSIVIHCADGTRPALCGKITTAQRLQNDVAVLLYSAAADIRTYNANQLQK